jgi:hypothetical protein
MAQYNLNGKPGFANESLPFLYEVQPPWMSNFQTTLEVSAAGLQ